MRIPTQKVNKLYDSMIFRYCYPYAIYMDKNKETVAFINRMYDFMCTYEDDKLTFWCQLDSQEFNELYIYLSCKSYQQERIERFTEFYLYDDASAPMLGGMLAERYMLLLDNILKLLNKEYLTIMLSQKCRGFDFGKKQDGVFIEEKSEEKCLNLYDLAREDAERFLYGMV